VEGAGGFPSRSWVRHVGATVFGPPHGTFPESIASLGTSRRFRANDEAQCAGNATWKEERLGSGWSPDLGLGFADPKTIYAWEILRFFGPLAIPRVFVEPALAHTDQGFRRGFCLPDRGSQQDANEGPCICRQFRVGLPVSVGRTLLVLCGLAVSGPASKERDSEARAPSPYCWPYVAHLDDRLAPSPLNRIAPVVALAIC